MGGWGRELPVRISFFMFVVLSGPLAEPAPPLNSPAMPSPRSPWRLGCPSPTWPSRPVPVRASSHPTKRPTNTSRDGPCVPPGPSGMPQSSTGTLSRPMMVQSTMRRSLLMPPTLHRPLRGVRRLRMPCQLPVRYPRLMLPITVPHDRPPSSVPSSTLVSRVGRTSRASPSRRCSSDPAPTAASKTFATSPPLPWAGRSPKAFMPW
mmetsp:Transcript_36911/g.80801  ORF Transcript_36911/g.80801 Transcript_36911/m.80801 type:complete len:206 (+) Transcript_36911:607-1224(+)